MRRARAALLAGALAVVAGCDLTPEALDALRGWQEQQTSAAMYRGLPCPEYADDVAWRGLPEHFLIVIWNESRCNPAAVNRSSGAVGLTQIMPSWLRALCPMGIACTVADLKEPLRNLDAASVVYDAQGAGAWSGW